MRTTILAVITCLGLCAPALGQSTMGCDAIVADQYEALAETTRLYLDALGPNIHAGNYPGDMRAEVDAFAEQRIDLYRKLEQFIVATEDFAYAVRRCNRK